MGETTSPFRVSRGKVEVLSPRESMYARPSVRHLKEEHDSNRKSWKSSVFGSLDVALGNNSNKSYNSCNSSNPNPLDDSTSFLNESISSFSSSKGSPTTGVKPKVTQTLLVSYVPDTNDDNEVKGEDKERLSNSDEQVASTKAPKKKPKRCLSAPNMRFDDSPKSKAQTHSSSTSSATTKSPRRSKKSSITTTSPISTRRKKLTNPNKNNNSTQSDNDDDSKVSKPGGNTSFPRTSSSPNTMEDDNRKFLSKGEETETVSLVVVNSHNRNTTTEKSSSFKDPNECSPNTNNVVNDQEESSSNRSPKKVVKSKKLKEKKPKRCQSAPGIHKGDDAKQEVSDENSRKISSPSTINSKNTTTSIDHDGKQHKKDKKKEKKPRRHQSAPDIHGVNDSDSVVASEHKTNLNGNRRDQEISSLPISPKESPSSIVGVGQETLKSLNHETFEEDSSRSNRGKEIQSTKQKKKKPNKSQYCLDMNLEVDQSTKTKTKQESRSISKSPKRKLTKSMNNNHCSDIPFLSETTLSSSPSVVSAVSEKHVSNVSNERDFPAEGKIQKSPKNTIGARKSSKIESKTSPKKGRKKGEAKPMTTTGDEEGNKTRQQKVRSKKPKRCQSAPNIHLDTEKEKKRTSKSPRRKGSIVRCNKTPPKLRHSKRLTIPNLDDDGGGDSIDSCTTSHQNNTVEASKATISMHAPSSSKPSSSRETVNIKSFTALSKNNHRSLKGMNDANRHESNPPLLSNSENDSTTPERNPPSAATVDEAHSDMSNQGIPAANSPSPNVASHPLAPTTTAAPPAIVVDDNNDDGTVSSNIELENKASCHIGTQIQEIPSKSPDPNVMTRNDEDTDHVSGQWIDGQTTASLLQKVKRFRASSPPPALFLGDEEDNRCHDAHIESSLMKKVLNSRSGSPPPPKYIGDGRYADDDASIDVLPPNLSKVPNDAHPSTNPFDHSSGHISAGESSTSDLSFVLPITCLPEGMASSSTRDDVPSLGGSSRSIQFSDVVHAKSIPLLGEEDIERLYYSEQNLDDFRHEAFLESAGLNPSDFD